MYELGNGFKIYFGIGKVGIGMADLKYSKSIALDVAQSLRKDLLIDMKKIFKSFNLLGTELRPNVRELVKNLFEVDEEKEIQDEAWIGAVDLYYLFYDYFRLRKAWINANCSGFFNMYQIIDED